MKRIGFDIGLTKIECVVLDVDNTVIFRERQETNNDVFGVVPTLYRQALNSFGGGEHTIGIGFPNKTNKRGEVVKCSIEQLNGIKIQERFTETLRHPVNIANDSHCFALAEAVLGAGKNHKRVFGAIIGSGVGGGLAINGKLDIGHNGLLGEWGHTNLDPRNDILCRCGLIGCVETWLAGRWVNDPTAFDHQQFRERYFDKFGQAMANVIHTIDPDCIVLGGGVSNQEGFYTLGVQQMKHYLLDDEYDVPLLKAELGDSAGVIGAALL